MKCGQQCAITYAKYFVDHISDVVFGLLLLLLLLLVAFFHVQKQFRLQKSTMSRQCVRLFVTRVRVRSGKYPEMSVAQCQRMLRRDIAGVSLAHFLITPQFVMYFASVVVVVVFTLIRFIHMIMTHRHDEPIRRWYTLLLPSSLLSLSTFGCHLRDFAHCLFISFSLSTWL